MPWRGHAAEFRRHRRQKGHRQVGRACFGGWLPKRSVTSTWRARCSACWRGPARGVECPKLKGDRRCGWNGVAPGKSRRANAWRRSRGIGADRAGVKLSRYQRCRTRRAFRFGAGTFAGVGIGITPAGENSTAGHNTRALARSAERAMNSLRRLAGASAPPRSSSRPRRARASAWASWGLLARKPKKLAAGGAGQQDGPASSGPLMCEAARPTDIPKEA